MPLIELKSNLSNVNYNYNKEQKSLLELSSDKIKGHDNLKTSVNIDSTLKENNSYIKDQINNPIYLDYIDKLFFGAKNIGKPLYYTVDYFSARLNETVPLGFSALFNNNNVSLLLSNDQKEIVLRPLTYDVIDKNNKKFNFDVQFGIGTNWQSKFIDNVGNSIEPIQENLKKTYQNIINGIFKRPDRQPHKIPNYQNNVKGTEFSLLIDKDYRIKYNNYNIKSIFDIDNDYKIDDTYTGLFSDVGLRDKLLEVGSSWILPYLTSKYTINSPFILDNANYFYDPNIVGGVDRDAYKPYGSALSQINFGSRLTGSYNESYPIRLPYTIDEFNINNMLKYGTYILNSIFDIDNDYTIDDTYTGLFSDVGLRNKLNKINGSWKIKNAKDGGDYYTINSPFILDNANYFYDPNIVGGLHRDVYNPYFNSILPIDFEGSNLQNKYLDESILSHIYWFEEDFPFSINNSFIGKYEESFDYVSIYNINNTNFEEGIFFNIISEIDDYNTHVSRFDTIEDEINNEEKIFDYTNLKLYNKNANNFKGISEKYNLDEYYARSLDPKDSLSIYNYDSNKLDPVNVNFFQSLFNEYKSPVIWSLPVNKEGKVRFNLDFLTDDLNSGGQVANNLKFSGIDSFRLYMATPLVFNQSWLSAFSIRPETRTFSKIAMYLSPILNSDFVGLFKQSIPINVSNIFNRTLFSGISIFNNRDLNLAANVVNGVLPIRFGQELISLLFSDNFLNYENWLNEVNKKDLNRKELLNSDYNISLFSKKLDNYLLYNRKNEYNNEKSDEINLKISAAGIENDIDLPYSNFNKDLCKLSFEYYNDALEFTEAIQFRSFLESLNEQVTPEWGNTKYIGHPMNVYNYKGVSRKITFSFKVAMFSKKEVPIVWAKLNTLMSLCYPKYNNEGRMMAPIIRLTIGDMYYKLPGFLDSITFDVDKNSPWEVEESQLPMIVNINTSFTVIGHTNPEMGSYINSSFDMFGQSKNFEIYRTGTDDKYLFEYKKSNLETILTQTDKSTNISENKISQVYSENNDQKYS